MAVKSTPIWDQMQRQAQFSGGRLLCRRGAGGIIELVDRASNKVEKSMGDPDWKQPEADPGRPGES